VFVYSVRDEPGIVRANFVNKERCALLCDILFLSHISLDQVWNEVMTVSFARYGHLVLILKRFGSKYSFVFPSAVQK
jgi:hypothetical protein